MSAKYILSMLFIDSDQCKIILNCLKKEKNLIRLQRTCILFHNILIESRVVDYMFNIDRLYRGTYPSAQLIALANNPNMPGEFKCKNCSGYKFTVDQFSIREKFFISSKAIMHYLECNKYGETLTGPLQYISITEFAMQISKNIWEESTMCTDKYECSVRQCKCSVFCWKCCVEIIVSHMFEFCSYIDSQSTTFRPVVCRDPYKLFCFCVEKSRIKLKEKY